MSMKLKVLGMGLLAMLATSAFAVMNASAESVGHFTNDASDGHATIEGIESGSHIVHLRRNPNVGVTEYIGCEEDEFTGTVTSATVTSITITPHYRKCRTTNEAETAVTVHTNGCQYTFQVTTTAPTPDEKEHPDITADLTCPSGKSIQITHPNCTITIHPQHVTNAGTYTTDVENGKHIVTLNVNAKFNSTYHGLCQFITPTNTPGELVGSVTVRGKDTAGNQVNVTAT